MNRKEEIRELEQDIRSRKRFDHAEWCRCFCHASPNPNWKFIVIYGGDVLDRLDAETRARRAMVVDIDGAPHTVLRVRRGLLDSLMRTKDFRKFFRFLANIIPPVDLKKFHYDLWLAAHNLEANIRRINELHDRTSPKKDGVAREVVGIFANNTVREGAKHYGSL